MYGLNWDDQIYNDTWEIKNDKSEPLSLKEKSVRGTISNRTNETSKQKLEAANLQIVDSCALKEDHDTLKLHFTLKVLSGIAEPSACNDPTFYEKYQERIQQYINEHGFTELSRRYAMNIANAGFLWRNRVGAEKIVVHVNVQNEERQQIWIFNALNFDIKTLNLSNKNNENDKKNIEALAQAIADALSGKYDFLLLEINSYVKVGKSQDVYPSEELVLDKNKSLNGTKSKILYAVNEVAAMHSQKIGNALRTIDTWYTEYTNTHWPIAIEPYGSVTNLGEVYRKPKDKVDFYSLFDNVWMQNESINVENDHYIVAMLIRGGVFGSDKKSNKKQEHQDEE